MDPRDDALARCFDWMVRKHPEIMAQNPLRLLKRGFATYTDADAQVLEESGRSAREDKERDRRLYPDEEPRILAQLQDIEDERVLYILALESAMRMRECYTLNVDQVSLPKRTISLERSKNGDTRQVPLSTTILALLASYLTTNRKKIAARDGRLFPFWNGERDQTTLKALTSDLSARFARVFDAAGAADFRFHDCGMKQHAGCTRRPSCPTC